MKINELFSDVNFKETFNAVYKNYYKNQKLPQHKMVELSMSFNDLFEKCKTDDSEIQSIINKKELAAHILYYLSK